MNISTEMFLKYSQELFFKEETSHKMVVDAQKGVHIATAAKEAMKLRYLIPLSQSLILIFNEVELDVKASYSWQQVVRSYYYISNEKRLAIKQGLTSNNNAETGTTAGL